MMTYVSYTKILKEIREKEQEFCQKYSTEYLNFYYRGHGDQTWRLIPSLARVKRYPALEKEIIQNAMQNHFWKTDQTLFYNIAYLQHYGRPTRFLDFTTDVNIALYFACAGEKHKNDDGALYICPYYDAYRDWYSDTQMITELSLLKQDTPLSSFCQQLLQNVDIKNRYGSVKELGMNILAWLDHGFMVSCSEEELKRLKDWNPRLYNQKGAFFIFGNQTDPRDVRASSLEVACTTILHEIALEPKVIQDSIKIIIPKDIKQSIIDCLGTKGITEAFIYPDQ